MIYIPIRTTDNVWENRLIDNIVICLFKQTLEFLTIKRQKIHKLATNLVTKQLLGRRIINLYDIFWFKTTDTFGRKSFLPMPVSTAGTKEQDLFTRTL